MDVGTRNWAWQIAMYCMLPIAATFLIVILLATFIVLHTRALREKRHEEAAESRYRALFEGSPDAVMILDEGRFMDCNAATLKMFGYSSQNEFTALHPADVSPPRQPDGIDSRTAADQHIATALRHGTDRFEWTHRRRMGEDFPAEVWLTALQMGERRVIQATVRDITKRKQMEDTLRESEEKFRSYVENAPDGVFIVDDKGRYIEVNKTACRMTGYSKEELEHLSVRDLLAEESSEDGMAHFTKLMETGVATSDLWLKQKDGSRFCVTLAAVKLSTKPRCAKARNDSGCCRSIRQ
jgi:PAS domain S-box-containing protein